MKSNKNIVKASYDNQFEMHWQRIYEKITTYISYSIVIKFKRYIYLSLFVAFMSLTITPDLSGRIEIFGFGFLVDDNAIGFKISVYTILIFILLFYTLKYWQFYKINRGYIIELRAYDIYSIFSSLKQKNGDYIQPYANNYSEDRESLDRIEDKILSINQLNNEKILTLRCPKKTATDVSISCPGIASVPITIKNLKFIRLFSLWLRIKSAIFRPTFSDFYSPFLASAIAIIFWIIIFLQQLEITT